MAVGAAAVVAVVVVAVGLVRHGLETPVLAILVQATPARARPGHRDHPEKGFRLAEVGRGETGPGPVLALALGAFSIRCSC